MDPEFSFSWEGAAHPDGPWHQLRVIAVRARDELGVPYRAAIELVRHPAGADLDVETMIGARATLRIRTRSTPAYRLVHGIIVGATELADAVREGRGPGNERFRIDLASPLERAEQMKKSVIFLDRTIREVVDATLQRQATRGGSGSQRPSACGHTGRRRGREHLHPVPDDLPVAARRRVPGHVEGSPPLRREVPGG